MCGSQSADTIKMKFRGHAPQPRPCPARRHLRPALCPPPAGGWQGRHPQISGWPDRSEWRAADFQAAAEAKPAAQAGPAAAPPSRTPRKSLPLRRVEPRPASHQRLGQISAQHMVSLWSRNAWWTRSAAVQCSAAQAQRAVTADRIPHSGGGHESMNIKRIRARACRSPSYNSLSLVTSIRTANRSRRWLAEWN